ncbi:HXXXD-type acyl-transferase family protein [Euphorbia peplus]|nr:HXXXD-type acyl-transferase family protein [Euphorbia peplus]
MTESRSGTNAKQRSLKLIPMRSTTDTNYVRGTFKLSGEDIKNIRQKVVSQLLGKNKQDTNELNPKQQLSTFVLSYAYVSMAIIKAKDVESNKIILIKFAADARARLDPPVPSNYFGNCVTGNVVQKEVEYLMKEDGLCIVAEELTKLIKELEKKGGLSKKAKEFEGWKKMDPTTIEGIGVAGSPRLGVYGIDFGWGKPIKVELTSIDRSTTSISMAEIRDENGGVEIGVVLKKDEMKNFESFFVNGLN